MVFDIQRYSLHDGAGIRTLVFFKGCPLRCRWCSNPESQEFGAEIMYDLERCLDFADCRKILPGAITPLNDHGIQIERKRIVHPELLRHTCASGALKVTGESLSVEEILSEVAKDIPFYKNEGGVTLSGGEPLSQGTELIALLEAFRDLKISVYVETSLHVPWEKVARCHGLVDTFLVDLKHVDPVKFRSHVQGEANLVMQNLVRLIQQGEQVILRIPVIPDFNHSTSEMEMMLDWAATLKGVEEVHLLPYHTFGKKKYQMLGREYLYEEVPAVDETELLPYLDNARLKGFKAKIGG